MGERKDHEVLVAEADFGWVNDESDVRGLSEVQLEAMTRKFGSVNDDIRAELRKRLPDAYRGFIKKAKYEISRSVPAPDGKTVKPSTAVSRDLKRINKAVEGLEQVLGSVDPATKDWIGLFFEGRGIRTENGSIMDFELLRRRLDFDFGLLVAAAREGEGLSARGPSNAATKDLIRRLANLWERAHGTLPTSDKGRGNRDQEPFLELCRTVHSIGRSELTEAGYHLGVGTLTRVVSDVLKQMKNEATS